MEPMRLWPVLLTLAIALAVVLAVLVLWPEPGGATVRGAGTAVSVAFIAAAIAAAVPSLRLSGRLQAWTSHDPATRRAVKRAVLHGDGAALADPGRRRASGWAAAYLESQRASTVLTALILASATAQNIALVIIDDGLREFGIVCLALVVALALVGGAIAARRYSSARRYLRGHLIDATAGSEPAK
jgi:hypothetical protein